MRAAFVRLGAVSLAMGALALPAPVAAQPYEFVYGATATADVAQKRVSPVTACPGGGSIAVGTVRRAGTADVYVIRAKPSGFPIWELTYDLGPGQIDMGEALVELADGSGFVIAGSTQSGATGQDVFLMKIRCGGGVVWAHAYHSPLREGAFDVIEARTGDLTFGTRRGDLLVAGHATNPAGGDNDALLLRTNAAGTLIWNRRYDVGHARELFRGVTEARPSGGTSAGDVVAVGSFTPGGGSEQGYAVRVSGNHGLLGAAPHCAAAYGATEAESFHSVVQLSAGTLAGRLAIAGSTRPTFGASDLYLVGTSASPCAPFAQRRVGDPPGGRLGDEGALDLKEVTSPLGIAAVGQIALTGWAGRPGSSSQDAFLLIADAASLKPIPGTGRLYGDHGAGQERGHSLAVLPDGFLIAGVSTSDFEGVGDPADVYLVNPDTNGKTACAVAWDPPHDESPRPVASLGPSAVRFLQQVPVKVEIGQQSTPFDVCP